jgi:fructuronate reductase
VHDLAHPEAPNSAPGLIVAALERRRRAGLPPFTVLSCDNLPANGRTAGRIIRRLAALISADLGRYAETVAFPSSMVDRIVPATTDTDRAEIAALTGVDDAWPVVTEPFTQWVIEDNFPLGRPNLARVGVEFVADVEPAEHMKLRMLNGSHSTLAYLGYLAGHAYVADAIADPDFRRLIEGFMTEEVIPTLAMPPEALRHYRDRLIARFANPALRHRTWQIAMDGSQKLPQRLLGTIRDRLAAGLPFRRLALGVAGWMRYVAGRDDAGTPIDVRDPLAPLFADIGGDAGRLFALTEIFGDLSGNPVLEAEVLSALTALRRDGAKATVRAYSAA